MKRGTGTVTFILQTQTLARAYAELISEEVGAERSSIGDFVDEFFRYAVEERQLLLDSPLQIPEHPTDDQLGWAAFCAGAAEYLAERYHLTCPDWALDQAYTLTELWYHPASRAFPALKTYFQETAPEPFRRRNVFCSDRVFTNPYASSDEPGTLADLHQRRMLLLTELPEDERKAYLVGHAAKMQGKPRVTMIVA